MQESQLTEVIGVLGNERRLFWYFPGRFAFLLLADIAAQGTSVQDLKTQPEARLLRQASVRRWLGQRGNGALHAAELANHWNDQAVPFALSIGAWGNKRHSDWYQTSRCGFNLVLRLDFTGAHMAQLRQRFGEYDWLFNSDSHPVSADPARRRETLAWARLDFDFDTDEVLIEELQSDWVRDAAYAARHGWYTTGRRIDKEVAKAYVEEELEPLIRLWPEAILSAALWFVRHELGISRIFYHEHRTGCALKGIRGRRPPRSLYSELPKRFCMSQVDEAPAFLQDDKRARRVLRKLRPHHFFFREVPKVCTVNSDLSLGRNQK